MTNLVFIRTTDGLPLVVRTDGTLRLPTLAEVLDLKARRRRESDDACAPRIQTWAPDRDAMHADWLEQVLKPGAEGAPPQVAHGLLAVEPLVLERDAENLLPGDLARPPLDQHDQQGVEGRDLRLESLYAFHRRCGVYRHLSSPTVNEVRTVREGLGLCPDAPPPTAGEWADLLARHDAAKCEARRTASQAALRRLGENTGYIREQPPITLDPEPRREGGES